MNWKNYDRLVQYLKDLDPKEFDYMSGYRLDKPGCIDCHCRKLMGNSEYILPLGYGGGMSIQKFLNVTLDEAVFLWAPASKLGYRQMPAVEGNHYAGAPAIAAALRKLEEVAGHYTRPEVPAEASEAVYLAELHQMAEEILKEKVMA